MIPHEKALVERLKDAPFALVGVNTDTDKDLYRQKVAEHGVTWRSAWEGSTEGPLPSKWGIDAYPTLFVLDAQHVLRFESYGDPVDDYVDALLAELAKERTEKR